MSATALDIIQTFSDKLQCLLDEPHNLAKIQAVKQYLTNTVSEYDFGKLKSDMDVIILLFHSTLDYLESVNGGIAMKYVNLDNLHQGFRLLCSLEGRLMYSNPSEPQGVQK